MDTSRTDRRCPTCGAALPADAPLGACPACLLNMAVQPASQLTDAGTDGFTDAVSSGASANEPARFADGDTFGPYRIVRLLGRGGMGEVYEAVSSDGRQLALKVLRERLRYDADRERFLREGVLAASVAHPNCIYVYGSEEIDGVPVIAMELAPQGTLKQAIEQFGPRTPKHAVREALQIVAGLEAAANAGILHRDVKPSNCFVAADESIKVGDFGLSVSLNPGDGDIVWKPTFQGTPEFASPEQLRGEPLDVRADIYSVGATLFYLLTGYSPFRERNIAKLIELKTTSATPSPTDWLPGLPEPLVRLVGRCMSPDPNRRPQTYAELIELLRPFAREEHEPASLPMRLMAWMVDGWLWSMAGSPLTVASRSSAEQAPLDHFIFGAIGVLAIVLFERFLGATPGKLICGLRVVDHRGEWPSFWLSFKRWGLSMGPTSAGLVLQVAGVSYLRIGGLSPIQPPEWLSFISLAYWLISIFLAQVRPDRAMLHDIWTRTRVVRWQPKTVAPVKVAEQREATQSLATEAADVKQVGPFEVIGRLGKTHDGDVLLARDPRLRRFVWIHRRETAQGQLIAARRQLTQPTRLRWLAGDDTWDAFEAPDGRPFSSACRTPQSWARVRSWLIELSRDLEGAEAVGALPPLAIDNLWVLSSGHIMLLDFAAPGAERRPDLSNDAVPAFLIRVAVAANGAGTAPHSLNVTLKAMAEPWVNARWAAAVLQQLSQEPVSMDRWRRAVPILVCALPVALSCGSALLHDYSVRARFDQPDAVLVLLLEKMNPYDELQGSQRTRNLLREHVAGTFQREIDANPDFWNTSRGRSFGKHRAGIENYMRWFVPTSADEIAASRQAAESWFIGERQRELAKLDSAPLFGTSGVAELAASRTLMPLAVASLLMSLLASPLLFRISRQALLDEDGLDAGVGRRVLRAAITWSPVALIPFAVWIPVWIPVAMLLVGAIYAVVNPERGIQDRIAGTYIAPR